MWYPATYAGGMRHGQDFGAEISEKRNLQYVAKVEIKMENQLEQTILVTAWLV